MSVGAYAVIFDMSRATLKARPPLTKFEVLYNGDWVAEYTTRGAADDCIVELAEECNTALSCFSIREVPL